MKRLPSIALALLLGIILAGGHLALLQGVAWASMLVSRAGSGSLAAAVSTTFDGKHPCGMCEALERHEHDAGPAKPAPDLTTKKMKGECLLLAVVWQAGPARTLAARLDTAVARLASRAVDAPPLPPPIAS